MGSHDEIKGKGEYVVRAPDAQPVAYETAEAANSVAKNVKGAKVTRRADDGTGPKNKHGRRDGK